MKSIILGNIGALTDLFMAGLFLYWYFNKKQEKLYRKKWVLIGSFLWVGMAGNGFYQFYAKEQNNRIPTMEEAKEAFSEENQYAKDATVYSSKDGYSVTIPEGFSFVPEKHGAVSLMAVKDITQNSRYTIIITRIQATGYSVPQVMEKLKTKHQNLQYILSGEGKEREVTYTFEDQDGFNKGLMRFLKKSGFLYNISAIAKNVSREKDSFPSELEMSVNSFKLR